MHIYAGNEDIYEIKTTVPAVAPHRCWLITVEIYTYAVEIDLDGDLDDVVEILMETDVVEDLEFWNGPDESLSDRRDRQITVQPRNT